MSEYKLACTQVTCEVVDIINACKRLDKILHENREHWSDEYYYGVTSSILKLCEMFPGGVNE